MTSGCFCVDGDGKPLVLDRASGTAVAFDAPGTHA